MSVKSAAKSCMLLIDSPDGGAPQWGTPVTFTASGAGSTSTIVSTTLGSLAAIASDDALVGQRVRCVDASDARNINCEARITAFDDATSTLTIDQLPAATASGDAFQLIANTAPYVAEDTGATSATCQDAGLYGADDYWIGYAETGGPYVEVVEADNPAKTSLRRITDSVDAGGVLTVTPILSGNTTIGDLYEIWCCPEAMNNALFDCQIEPLPREAFHGTFDTPGDALGMKTAQVSVEYAFRGPGSGRDGEPAELHRFLASPLDDSGDVGDLTVNGAGSTSSIPYDSGSATVGRMYCTAEGDAFMCISAGTPAVPSPDLRSVCSDDSTVVGLRTYTPSDDLNYHLAAKQYQGDGIIEYIWGIAPTFTIKAELNKFCVIAAQLQGSDWYRTYKDSSGAYTRAWKANRPTVNPVKCAGGRIVLGDTELKMKSFEITLGQTYEPNENVHSPNGMIGYQLHRVPPRGKLTGLCSTDNIGLLEDHESHREITDFLIQVGSKTGFPGVLAFWAYKVQVTNLVIQKDGNKVSLSCDWKVNDHDSLTVNQRWALGIG